MCADAHRKRVSKYIMDVRCIYSNHTEVIRVFQDEKRADAPDGPDPSGNLNQGLELFEFIGIGSGTAFQKIQ
jgi:hypothetical protein